MDCVPFKHFRELSYRHGSWFAQSNPTLEDILQYTYFWYLKLSQKQIFTLIVSYLTNFDWANFCKEVCMSVFEPVKDVEKLTLILWKNK